MNCDTPYYVLPAKWATEKIPVPCGRCPVCKARRVNQWVFRLLQEDKVSSSAYFVTLTYDTRYVPITENGFMTLSKSDVQKYFKRLRKLVPQSKIKYYLAGEYGSQTKRPHYHAIIFNVPDRQMFFDAWSLEGSPLGGVHVGQVSSDSIAYTLKYIDKNTFRVQHSRDDRLPEFSLMSKGLGSSYLSDEVKRYHKAHIDKLYVTKLSGHKVSMPRYYRNKIYSEAELTQQVGIVQTAISKQESDDFRTYQIMFPDERITFEQYKETRKYARYRSHYSSNNQKRDKI